MNKYDGLLLEVAQEYSIKKGTNETENEWKTRIVYSICGMMAYASVWDNSDDAPISIVHLKRKVRAMLSSYRSIYPELSSSLPYNFDDLEDEITEQFLSTGIVYHRPSRIAPSLKREELYGNILFQRGIALDEISSISGIGFYSKRSKSDNSDGIKSMFGLEQENLITLWSAALSNASWKTNLPFERDTEYLRLKPPFSQGYWVNRPDTTGIVSILRTGMKGSQSYYLYRCSGAAIEASPLPSWQVESYNYRLLACSSLLTYGTLPPIEYFEDGALVHIHLNYLLPPHELEFLKLYSWPETCNVLPCTFKRKLSTEVFKAIRSILSDEGYQFERRIL